MSNTTPAATIAAVPKNDVRTPATEFWRKFKKQKLAVGAGLFVLLLVIVAVFAPWIVPYTTIGEIVPGRMWRMMIVQSDAPTLLTAST